MVQLVIFLLAIVLLTCFTYYIGQPMISLVSDPGAFRIWIEERGIWGVLAFMGMMIFQVFAAVIPGGPFQIGAGYAFGIWKGSLICSLSCTLASVLVFLLVRKFGVRFIELFISKEKLDSVKFLQSNDKVEGILFLLFLIPGTPKDIITYFAGLTHIKLSHWIFICAVGRFPAIFLSTLSGSALNSSQYHIAIIAMVIIVVFSILGGAIYKKHTETNTETK